MPFPLPCEKVTYPFLTNGATFLCTHPVALDREFYAKFTDCLTYCCVPLCRVTFCIHSGIIPVGQFSRKCAKAISQTWTFIINIRVNFDLIGLLDSYRPICFRGAWLKWLNITGWYSIFWNLRGFQKEPKDWLVWKSSSGSQNWKFPI